MAKIFIAGSMRTPDYYDRFNAAARVLLQRGHDVINPVWEIDPAEDRPTAIRKCLDLIDSATAVCFLPGWEDSPGAQVEYAYCIYTSTTIGFSLDDF